MRKGVFYVYADSIGPDQPVHPQEIHCLLTELLDIVGYLRAPAKILRTIQEKFMYFSQNQILELYLSFLKCS